jgi:hypothetical protein
VEEAGSDILEQCQTMNLEKVGGKRNPTDTKSFGSYRDAKSLAALMNSVKPVLGERGGPGEALKR